MSHFSCLDIQLESSIRPSRSHVCYTRLSTLRRAASRRKGDRERHGYIHLRPASKAFIRPLFAYADPSRQPTPIPSYLIAIASGDVRYKAFEKPSDKEWKSGIWAEPSLIDSAFWEFKEDTTRFLAKEEDIVTPYRFGVYDLLVLPPSFPYGGMVREVLTV